MARPLAPRIGRDAAAFARGCDRIDVLPGLSDAEIARAESWLGAAFASDHLAFLREVLPHGPGWPDWRHLDTRRPYVWMQDGPVQGVLFDVRVNAFWHPGWGPRPDDAEASLSIAEERLAAAPRLIRVYGHRYLPAAQEGAGHPVLSVHQTDVICYGADLEDYLHHEFVPGTDPARRAAAVPTVTFWRDLV